MIKFGKYDATFKKEDQITSFIIGFIAVILFITFGFILGLSV